MGHLLDGIAALKQAAGRLMGQVNDAEALTRTREGGADTLGIVGKNNQALAEAQQFTSSVITSMSDVMIVCDAQGKILQVNRALQELVGCAEAKLALHLQGVACQKSFSPPAVRRLRQSLRNRPAHRRPSTESLVRIALALPEADRRGPCESGAAPRLSPRGHLRSAGD
jgi:PAS domain-containing protein